LKAFPRPSVIRAVVGNYRIELDLGKRMLKHDCEDWRKGLQARRICKHIVKLLLTVEPQKAKKIMRDLTENKSSWTFQTLISEE